MNDLRVRLVLEEDRVVVVDKPCDLTSEDAAAELGMRLVHRIDRATSGLLLLARDARTVTRLQRALAAGDVERHYRFVANGVVHAQHLESTLVRDRGDGLRGSCPGGSGPGGRGAVGRGAGGKLSAADVSDCVVARDRSCTAGVARLVTGRTHQLRIQLAEAGHPIVGEQVYVRDARRLGMPLLDAPRLMLHAEHLAFVHPGSKRLVEVDSPPPASFAVLP